VALDVGDGAALGALVSGATSVINAVNPASYTRWERDWPPLAAAILNAAEEAGARLVTVSNLYLYGQVTAPMTEATPIAPTGPKGAVRARMWADALDRHRDGRLRAVEVRASDYLGPETLSSSLLGGMILAPLLRGRTAYLPMGRRDVPHSWTYDGDVAALVARLARSEQESDYGRAWHVPTADPVTVADVLDQVQAITDRPLGRLRVLPRGVVTGLGPVVPLLGALRETRHQFERPFVLDSTAAQQRFGLAPTPLTTVLARTIAAIHARSD